MLNSNINKRETFTTFDHEGRRFIINSYNPLVGNYLLIQAITFVLPFGLSNILSSSIGGTEQNLSIGKSSKIMSKEEFIKQILDQIKNLK